MKAKIGTKRLNQIEAAKYLGISRGTLQRHLEAIPHAKLGPRVYLFTQDALDDFLAGRAK